MKSLLIACITSLMLIGCSSSYQLPQRTTVTATPSAKASVQLTESAEQRGWQELASITRSESNSDNNLLDKIQEWQGRYPNHPARKIIENSGTRHRLLSKPPQHIALLLPLSGVLAKQGQAIRNGFLAAYYQKKSSGYAPNISVFDTSKDSITTTYNLALQSGADVIVGPLLKSEVETLAASQRLGVPTIALNTLSSNSTVNNLYQFGLDPESEVQQVAEKLQTDQRNHVLIITSNDTWGQRITTSFQPYWQKMGGKIATEIVYKSRAELSDQLRTAFNLDASQRRYNTLTRLLNTKIRFVPRRRQDFDAIFLVASPEMGRQIIPLIRFYYAGDVPIYSTSQIYRGYASLQHDRDLDGVIFDDMPWLFSQNLSQPAWINTVQQQVQSAWPQSYNAYPRLYALGTDAFALAGEISKMSLLPDVGISSATGELFLEQNGKVYRKLIWAHIKNGQAKPLN